MKELLNIGGTGAAVSGLFANIANLFLSVPVNVYLTIILSVLGIVYLILKNRRVSAEIKSEKARLENEKLDLDIKLKKLEIINIECEILKNQNHAKKENDHEEKNRE